MTTAASTPAPAPQPSPPGPKKKPGPPPPTVRPGFLAVGVALTSFGVRGDIKVEPLTDFPERFEPGARLWLAGEQRTIVRRRWGGNYVFVKLAGIDTPEQVAQVRGAFFEVPEGERLPPPPDVFFQSDIIGMAVVTTDGRALGAVVEFLPSAGNDVVLVRGSLGEVLVPLIEDVVREIDVPARRMLIEALSGLLPDGKRERPADE